MAEPFETRSPFLTASFCDLPAGVDGHVHGRLVGLERDERRVDRDRIARLDEHLDDFDVVEVAKVGDADSMVRSRPPAQLTSGSGLAGSIPNFFIARVTLPRVDACRRRRAPERGDHDPLAVDLEMLAQLRARIAAAESIGAERDIRPRHPLADLVGTRSSCSRSPRRTGPCGPARHSLHLGLARLVARVQHGSSARLASASRRSSLKLVTLQTSAGMPNSFSSNSAAASTSRRIVPEPEQRCAHACRVPPMCSRYILEDPLLDALRHRRLRVVLVHHGDVVEDAFLLRVHAPQAVLHDDGELVGEARDRRRRSSGSSTPAGGCGRPGAAGLRPRASCGPPSRPAGSRAPACRPPPRRSRRCAGSRTSSRRCRTASC